MDVTRNNQANCADESARKYNSYSSNQWRGAEHAHSMKEYRLYRTQESSIKQVIVFIRACYAEGRQHEEVEERENNQQH